MKGEKEKAFVKKWADENTQVFYQAAQKIWESPELSMQEHVSSKVLIDLLKENGFLVETGIAGMPTAFIASYGEGKPVIGINAEYDALPGLSQESTIYRKAALKEGAPGHGCGHNLLGTATVKAAIGIKNAMEKFSFKGTIKVFGTPAEELCLGKPFMGKARCFENVDAFLDWHPWSYNRADYDSCCAYFSVKYHFKGKTCHGNSPWHGNSALDAAMLQAHGVEMMREHLYPGNPPDAANTINYTFTHTGPEFPSVVPDTTTAWYIGRFITTAQAKDALARVNHCAQGAALATQTQVEIQLVTATNHKIPNKTLAEVVYKNFTEIGAPQFTEEEQEIARQIQKQMGVEETGIAREIQEFKGGYTVLCDTSEYSWNAPYASPWIAMGPENIGWHNWGVALCAGASMGQKSMDIAAKVISSTAIDLLCDDDLIKTAKKEWKERLGDKKYECLIPEQQKPPLHLNEEVMQKYNK